MLNSDFIIDDALYKIGLQSLFYSIQLICSKEKNLFFYSADLLNSKFQSDSYILTISVEFFKRKLSNKIVNKAPLKNTKAVLKSKCLHHKIHFTYKI